MVRKKVHESATARAAAAIVRLRESGGDRRAYKFDAETIRALARLKQGFDGNETALVSGIIRKAAEDLPPA
jgi:hypothetical protein